MINDYATVIVSAGYEKSLRVWDCKSHSTEPIQVLICRNEGERCLKETSINSLRISLKAPSTVQANAESDAKASEGKENVSGKNQREVRWQGRKQKSSFYLRKYGATQRATRTCSIVVEESVRSLDEKLASALDECNAKDELVTTFTKMAEEAIAAHKKAEAEILCLNEELEEWKANSPYQCIEGLYAEMKEELAVYGPNIK